MKTKQNDFLATILYNPQSTLYDLYDAGLNSENTDLKDKDYYQNLDIIKQTFKKDSGEFDQETFDKYYDQALKSYNTFVEDNTLYNNVKDDILFNDNRRELFSNLGVVGFNYNKNPYKATWGLTGNLFEPGQATLSFREVAQNNKIRDANGNKLDITPNDLSGLKFFTSKPMYYDKYESDGWHYDYILKKTVKHKKGEYRLDEEGLPYVKELGENEDTSGKEFVSWTDVLTTDGSEYNKWDFLDSDGLDKSITGSTVKMVSKVAPYFIPYVGPVYFAVRIAGYLGDAIATIGKIGIEAFDSDYKNNETWKAFNTFNAYASTYFTDPVTSDKARESFFNYEGITNLIGEVASQGAEQKLIVKGSLGIMKLLKLDKSGMNIQKDLIKKYGKEYTEKYGRNLTDDFVSGSVADDFVKLVAGPHFNRALKQRDLANKVARNMASTYMTITQASNVTDAMKEAGYDSKYNAVGSVVALLAFDRLMRSDIGSIALRGMGLDDVSSNVNKIIKNYTDEYKPIFEAANNSTSKMVAVKSMANKVYDDLYTFVKNNEFAEIALKEGLEETSEELLQDGVMKLTEGLAWLNDDTSNGRNTFNYLESDPLMRYMQAFVGGAIGGPLTRGIDIAKSKLDGTYIPPAEKSDLDFVDLVRRFGGDKIIKALEKEESKNIFPETISLNGELGNFKPVDKNDLSQKQLLFDYLKSYVRFWDSLIHEEGLAISNADLIDEALQKDVRARVLKDFGLGKEIIDNFNNLLLKLANANLKYKELYYSIKDTDKATDPNLAKVKADADAIRQQIKELREGTLSGEFIDKSLFKLNKTLNGSLYPSDIYSYSLQILGKEYDKLNTEEQKEVKIKYDAFKEKSSNLEDLAFKIFKQARELSQPNLQNINQNENIINSIKELNEKLDELAKNKELQLAVQKPLDENVLEELINKAKEGTTLDEIINKNGLNKRNENLTAEQKEQIVNTFLAKKINDEYNLKQTEDLVNNYHLGLDSRYYGTINDLQNIINLIQEIKSNYGFIDFKTKTKLQNLFKYYNEIEFNLNNYINKLIEYLKNSNKSIITDGDYMDLQNLFSNYIDNFKKVLGEDFDLNDFEYSDLYIKSESTNEGFKYIIAFDSAIGKVEIEFSENEIKDILVGLINYKAGNKAINSFIDFKNLIEENKRDDLFKSLELEPTRTNLIESLNALLNEDDYNDQITDLITKISTEIYGENVLPIYKKILEDLISTENITDFIITDPNLEHKLNILKATIENIFSTLEFSTDYKGKSNEGNLFDFNVVINSYRKQSGLNQEEFQLISPEVKIDIFNHLNEIYADITKLQRLSEINKGNKIKEESIINNKMIASWLAILYNNINLKSFKVNNKLFFDKEPFSENIEIIKKALEEKDLTPEELIKIEKELLDLESYYYNKFQNLSEEDKELFISELAKFDVFGESSDKLNRNFDVNKISKNTLYNYILTIINYDSKVFKKNYIEILNSEEFNNIVPLYSQMFVVKQALSAFNGIENINKYISLNTELNEKRDEFKNLYLLNQIFISGSGGSGKTQVVAKMIKAIISKELPNLKFLSYAWKEDRAEELGKIINSESLHGYNIWNKFLNDEDVKTLIELKEELLTKSKELSDPDYFKSYMDKVNNLKLKLKSPDNLNFIIIDEYTHLSNIELYLLSSINNLFILNLGDPKQNGFKGVFGSGGDIPSFKTASLDISIRANNNHKKDNINLLAKMVDAVSTEVELSFLHKGNLNNVSNIVNHLKKNNIFKYYEDNELVYGEKIVDSLDVNQIENILKNSKGKKVAYIYDKEPKQQIKELLNKYNNFIIIKEDDVQGSEYDFVIININNKPLNATSSAEETLEYLKRWYTLITRSKEGSYLIRDPKLIFGNTERLDFVTDTSFNPKDIENYKEYINKVNTEILEFLKDIDNKIIEPENKEETVDNFNNPAGDLFDSDLKHRKSKQENEDKSKENYDSNFVVYQSFINYNWNNETGDNRNLANIPKEYTKNYWILKNLLFRNDDELQDIINNYKSHITNFQKIAELLKLKYPNISEDELLDILNKRKFIIQKVNTKTYKSEQGFNTKNFDYVYTFSIELDYNGNKWIIDLGVITDPTKLRSDISNILISLNENDTLDIDTSKLNLQFSRATIKKDDSLNYQNNSILQIKENNPWVNLDNTAYVASRKQDNLIDNIGSPFILYSRDLFKPITLTDFTNNDSNLVNLYLNFHGKSLEDYIHTWKWLFNNKKEIKFPSFSGWAQPFKIYAQLIKFKEFLEAKKKDPSFIDNESFNYNSITDIDKHLNNITKIIDLINADIHNYSNFDVDFKQISKNIGKTNNSTISLIRKLNNSSVKLSIELINKIVADENTRKAAIENAGLTYTSKIDEEIKTDFNNFLNLYNTLIDKLNKESNVLSTLTPKEGENTFTKLTPKILEWLISENYYPKIFGSYMLVNSFIKHLKEEGTDKFDKDLLETAKIAIENSNQFKNGIYNNGVFTSEKSQGFYKSFNSVGDYWLNFNILPSNAFISLDAIIPKKIENKEIIEPKLEENNKEKSNLDWNNQNIIVSLNGIIDENFDISIFSNKFNNPLDVNNLIQIINDKAYLSEVIENNGKLEINLYEFNINNKDKFITKIIDTTNGEFTAILSNISIFNFSISDSNEILISTEDGNFKLNIETKEVYKITEEEFNVNKEKEINDKLDSLNEDTIIDLLKTKGIPEGTITKKIKVIMDSIDLIKKYNNKEIPSLDKEIIRNTINSKKIFAILTENIDLFKNLCNG